jgi:hypothetical protein
MPVLPGLKGLAALAVSTATRVSDNGLVMVSRFDSRNNYPD